jgi:hypothetical protein
MIEESNISRETVIYNLELFVERCLGRKPFRRSMWRSGTLIEVETYEWHSGPAGRALHLLGKEIGMFKERGYFRAMKSLKLNFGACWRSWTCRLLLQERESWTLNFD